ncbi:MAG: PilN domain-containing protein [candidate division WWE3 bacterium]|nr:PilN domain-containing protein [candidate division WWE3 bacterium]
MPPLNNLSLNLIKPVSFEESGIGSKILYFFRVQGRLLIIIFQFLVVLSFVARYLLDQQLLPVNTRLSSQMLTLDKLKVVEDQLNVNNQRLLQLRSIQAKSSDLPGILVAVRGCLPEGLTLSQLNITSKSITINGSTIDAINFGKLLVALKQVAAFKQIALNSATYDKTHNSFLFNLEVAL